jgi:hypothetical protein
MTVVDFKRTDSNVNDVGDDFQVNIEDFEKMGTLNNEIAVPYCKQIAEVLRGSENDVRVE